MNISLYLSKECFVEEDMLQYKKLGFDFKPFDCKCGSTCYELVTPKISINVSSLSDLSDEFEYLIVDKDNLTMIPSIK